MDAKVFIRYLRTLPDYAGQVAHIEHIESRDALTAELDVPISPVLQERLAKKGFTSFYTHQAKAISESLKGQNVMVATSSASGKSLCYNISVLETLLNSPDGRAIYLFPTKALAQGQLRVLKEMFTPSPFRALEFSTFDGDTDYSDRNDIRKRARVILTNPDMLHVGILPNHSSWARLFRNLKYVVIDEAHSYRGVFGSHVAGVIRRLRRLCAFYGSEPRFILCSATIANPGEHAEQLTGLPFTVVDNDGSPHGEKEFVFWNPPILDEKRNTRRSTNSEATHLFTELVNQSVRTLAFAQSRRLTELIYSYSRDRLAEINPPLARRIMAYRAGYLAEDRRKIEKDLFGGQLLGAVATVALELGVDIGDLEATILTGYPGSIASTWQQAGRSGRGMEGSMTFLVAMDNPLDQYFMSHPEAFFQKSVENALINPENHYILRAHLLCAAWEMPLTSRDERYFSPAMVQEIHDLQTENLLRERGRKWYLAPVISSPAHAINIRSTGGEDYAVIDMNTASTLEMVDSSMAFFQIHPGAVYLHQGKPYLIHKLDLAGHTAWATDTDAVYYTQIKEIEDLRIKKTLKSRDAGKVKVFLGEVQVTNNVVGFKKKMHYTEEVVGEEPLDLPPIEFPTVSFWFDLPVDTVQQINESKMDFAGGLHATEHAAIAMLPLFTLCDRNDIGGVSTALHPDTGRAQVFIYDAYPGGIGIAEKGFDIIEDLWKATLQVVTDCPCEKGCPSCIQSPKCGNNNKPLDKQAAIELLKGLIA
ncbi:MAG: DEAD/DEAH box helicase [Dehalococcoidales bacterium]|nr:DEAD/DEAH box helicase [Dehalococcoidales bacterium]